MKSTENNVNKAGKKTTGEAIKAELVVNQYKENLKIKRLLFRSKLKWERKL